MAQFGNNPATAGGLQRQISAVTKELGTLESAAGRAGSSLIQNFANVEGFSTRAIAAMRGVTSAVKGETAALSERDAVTRAGVQGGQLLSQSLKDAIASTTGLGTVTANHIIRQRELNAAFGATEAGLHAVSRGSAVATTEIRHVVAAFDELSRNQRGAFISTLGASMRDAGSVRPPSATGMVALTAVVGGAAVLRGSEAMGKWAQDTLRCRRRGDVYRVLFTAPGRIDAHGAQGDGSRRRAAHLCAESH